MPEGQTPKPAASGRETNLARWLFRAGLLALVALGGWLRFSHADWDEGYQLHPDERAILFVAQDIQLPFSLREGLSASQSPLSPFNAPGGSRHSFPYGHLPLYLLAGTARLLAAVCEELPPGYQHISPTSFAGRLLNIERLTEFDHLTYVARALSALYDTATIAITGWLAGTLFDRRAGLVAAALAAFAVLHIQQAHFGTVDTALALFTTLTIWSLVRFSMSGRTRESLLAGVFFGMALGCKATAAFLIVPFVLAHREDRRDLVWSSAAIISTFTLTNPYVLLDPITYIGEVITQAQVAAGLVDWPFTRQYTHTVPMIYQVVQQARWTLGLPLTVSMYISLGWLAWRSIQDRNRVYAVIAAWLVVAVLAMGFQYAKFDRYWLPLTPSLFAITDGWLAHPVGTWRNVKLAWLAVVLTATPIYALAFTSMYATPHPWLTASRWIYGHIPPGTGIGVERWDDPLPLDMTLDSTSYLRDRYYRTRQIDPFALPDDETKMLTILNDEADCDYLILSSNRLYGAIPRLPEQYPYTAAYYRALFGGELGFVFDRSFSRSPMLLGVALLDDPFTRAGLPYPQPDMLAGGIVLGFADESFTVYDHPRVLVFRNQAHLTADQLWQIVKQQAESALDSN